MDEGTTYVGMDVHKRTIAVSIRFPDGTRDERTIPHETRAVNRLVRKMKREASRPIACAYEAGPCGYGLQRDLREQDLDCQVIAPSLIPRKPGEQAAFWSFSSPSGSGPDSEVGVAFVVLAAESEMTSGDCARSAVRDWQITKFPDKS
jgi:hypothetical protein